jgi:hypothetical protein
MTNSPSRAARPRNPGTLSVGEALKKYGITGSTIAGGHGTSAEQADIAPALGLDVTSRCGRTLENEFCGVRSWVGRQIIP